MDVAESKVKRYNKSARCLRYAKRVIRRRERREEREELRRELS